MSSIHRLAAEGFDSAAEDYEKGRPGYPEEAIATLVDALSITPTSRVVDVGAGTGKLTRALLYTGADIIAVEPVEGMRRQLASTTPEVQILDGTAEQLPLENVSVDAIVAGQAFHWFNGREALAEFHRVLRPGGGLGLIWNLRDESTDWVARLSDIIDPHESDVPRFKKNHWKKAFGGTGLFRPIRERRFRHVQMADAETMVARVASISFIATLPEDLRSQVLDQVRELLRTHPDTRERAEIELPYVTKVFWTTRRQVA